MKLTLDDEPVIYLSVWRFYFAIILIAAGFFGWGTVFYWVWG